jgi:opacity protein-like surface antigen
MTRKILMLAVVVLTLIWAPAAMAEMYVGAYGGATVVPDSDLKYTGALTGLELKGLQFDTGGSFGAKVGGWFKDFPYLAVEGNIWTTFTGISGTPDVVIGGFNYGATADLDADVTLINFSGSLLAQYPTSTFRPYAGIGLLVSYADIGDMTASVPGMTVTGPGEDTTSVGFMAQAGLEYKVTDLLGLFGEYRYTWANYEFEFAEIDVSTHNFLAGVAVHF